MNIEQPETLDEKLANAVAIKLYEFRQAVDAARTAGLKVEAVWLPPETHLLCVPDITRKYR